jgi:hypothetical protein
VGGARTCWWRWRWSSRLGETVDVGVDSRSVSRRPWDQHEKTGSGSTLAHQANGQAAVRRAVPDVYPITCRPGQDAREHSQTPRRAPRFPLWGALGIAERAD